MIVATRLPIGSLVAVFVKTVSLTAGLVIAACALVLAGCATPPTGEGLIDRPPTTPTEFEPPPTPTGTESSTSAGPEPTPTDATVTAVAEATTADEFESGPDAQPSAAAESALVPPPPDDAVDITVKWVLDGDSFEATTPWGWSEVRLLGVNANEGDECMGEEAKQALIALLGREDALLWVEVSETYGPDRDEFGRLLGVVWHDGVLVNHHLATRGLVVARSSFGHPYEELFEDGERSARENEVGLWSPVACGEPVDATIEIAELNFDAAGRDNENPNGEWIEIVNRDDAPLSLAGWSVRDESTRHRYRFAADITLGAGESIVLRSGCGLDQPGELFWCDPDGPVWSNSGDTAFVLDPAGNVAAALSYDSIYE